MAKPKASKAAKGAKGAKGAERRSLVLLVVIGGIMLWIGVAMLLIPGLQDASRIGSQVKAKREELKSLERLVMNKERVQEQRDRLEETVASLRDLLPAEEELPSIIDRLSDVASKARVKIQTIFPQLSFTEEDLAELIEGGEAPVYRTIPIQIDAFAGYHEIGTFLSLVESESTPMEIASLRITTNPRAFRRHNMRLVLNVFFAVTDGGKSTAAAGSL